MPNEVLDIRIGVSILQPDISIGIDRTWKDIAMGVDRGGAVYPEYAGPYHVIPALYWQQRLETYGKSMADDVLVDAIKITETGNPQGGKTIVIG